MTNPIHSTSSKNLLKDRSGVERRHASKYLLLTLLSFAFSVIATRIFLNLTGFPKLGSGELHIAHVLWGGLFLFIASLIPLIFINQWALELSSVLAGVGVGLFIDEVGKFITSTNDYFFPAAAPIIYAFFLLTVLVYVQVKRQRKPTPRAQMYAILEDFAEVLDRDLSRFEYDRLTSQLEEILAESKEEQLVALAQSLLNYLENQAAQVVPHNPSLLEKLQSAWNRLESGWLTRSKMKVILIIGLGLWAGWALTSQTIMFLATHNAQQFSTLVQQFMANRLIRNASGMNWFEAQILLEGTMGFVALVAVIFYLCGKDKIATTFGILDLVVTLTVVNLITFYFNQFSTIAFAIYQFILLIFLLLYRRRFLTRRTVKHHQSKKVQD
jgi:hypothetical protein